METGQPLRLLLIEDALDDATLLLRTLRQAGHELLHQRVETADGLHAALSEQAWDLVLSDHSMPRFDGMQALRIVRARGLDVPFIFVSGTIGEEAAVAAMRAGAQDYVMKDNLKRLPPAIARELREAELRRQNLSSEARFRNVLNTASDAIISIDEQWRIVIFNKGAETVFGHTEAEVLGQHINMLLPARFAAPHERHMQHYAAAGPQKLNLSYRREVYGLRKDGSEFPAEITISKVSVAGRATFTAILRDVTERKRMETRLDQLAHHDELTGLPNRRLLRVRMQQAMEVARRHGTRLVVLLLDLDRFKIINDSLGHEAGDMLIKQVGQVLNSAMRTIDTVARLGGDEFAILLTDIHRPEDAVHVSRKILEAFRAPFNIAGNEIHIGTSIGMTLFPNDGDSYEALLRNADIAMFRAKEKGGSRCQFYQEGMTERAVEQLMLEKDLRRAIDQQELTLVYQPQVERENGRIVAVEALVRWHHPERGDIGPADFIPLAEESGLILPLGEWVLRSACRQARAWHEAGKPLRVAVNVSARQFRNGDLAEVVARVLHETGAAAEWIEIEITESVLMMDRHAALAILTALKTAGHSISMDDFGTGYSSLSYLKRFPVDMLKIDRSFVSDLPADQDSAALTSAIIAMAHQLGIRVIAEGVETEAQRQFLEGQGCDIYQGYLFGRPLPWQALEACLWPAGATSGQA